MQWMASGRRMLVVLAVLSGSGSVRADVLHITTASASEVDAGVPIAHSSAPHYLFGYPIYRDPPFNGGSRPDYPQQFVEPPRYQRPSYDVLNVVKPNDGQDPLRKPTYDKPSYFMPNDDRPLYPQWDYSKPAYVKPMMVEPVYQRPNYVIEPHFRPADDRPIYDKPWLDRPEYAPPMEAPPEYRAPRYLPPPYIAPPK